MEENRKFYSQGAITLATYLGGPLAAGYLVKKNFEVLNQPDNAQKSLIIGIVSTIILFALILSLPETVIDNIPKSIIPLTYTAIIYFLVERFQGENLKQHKECGGEFYSGWKAAGVGAVSLVILLAGIAGAALLSGDFSDITADFDASTYDKEITRFVENETSAIAVFNAAETASPDYLVQELSKGLALWKDNKRIVEKLNSLENLPEELIEQNIKLSKYCDLRIRQSEMIIKAVIEDPDKYTSEIERIGLEIDYILEGLQ